jgi:SET domain-containing protein
MEMDGSVSVGVRGTMDNAKAVVRETARCGLGVFAGERIGKGEVIAMFDGPYHDGGRDFDAPNDPPLFVNDHAIQFEHNRLRDSAGIARLVNHSCDPNCGIKDLFKIVAMRDIEAGEEITWDYSMTEDSDWEMPCRCGGATCRVVVRGYRFLPQAIRKRYAGFISQWLIDDYGEE